MSKRTLVALKVLVWILCLAPIAIWVYQGFHTQLGANPVDRIQNKTGLVVIRLLMLTLAITPLRRLTGWNWTIKFRRLLGLFTFFYAFIHLMVYTVADNQLDIAAIVKDVGKRPFILLGMLGFLAMVPLAITSTAGWIRRMGGKNWNRLHKLIYFTGVMGVIHFWLRVKKDHSEPALYVSILVVLLGMRLIFWVRSRQRAARSALTPVTAEGD
ncbi:MAG TPA: protein-methionine-sulfoxide reductase heme-binding subunit MsrQ [Tepidisphaeraceae bacterium]|jgi:sulfoxide reductase heme-binding subunit YedZ|nr:protein-methionine-sulfoxide reductase heme-binding subunit MsrQ [Tepidisphaeraceae bacterium]